MCGEDGRCDIRDHSATKGEGRSMSLPRPGSSRAGRSLIASHASMASRSRAKSVRSLPSASTARSIRVGPLALCELRVVRCGAVSSLLASSYHPIVYERPIVRPMYGLWTHVQELLRRPREVRCVVTLVCQRNQTERPMTSDDTGLTGAISSQSGWCLVGHDWRGTATVPTRGVHAWQRSLDADRPRVGGSGDPGTIVSVEGLCESAARPQSRCRGGTTGPKGAATLRDWVG